MILARIVNALIQLVTVLVLARVLTSWFRPRYRTSANQWFFRVDNFIYRSTEPLLAPIRNILPFGGNIDLSPLILLLLLQLIGSWLVNALFSLGI